MLIDFDKSPSCVLKKNREARGVGEERGNWHEVGQVMETRMAEWCYLINMCNPRLRWERSECAHAFAQVSLLLCTDNVIWDENPFLVKGLIFIIPQTSHSPALKTCHRNLQIILSEQTLLYLFLLTVTRALSVIKCATVYSNHSVDLWICEILPRLCLMSAFFPI